MRPTSDFCPFLDSKSCSGTCSGTVDNKIVIRCPHLIEAELNQRHFSKDGTLPFFGKLTIIGKENNI